MLVGGGNGGGGGGCGGGGAAAAAADDDDVYDEDVLFSLGRLIQVNIKQSSSVRLLV